MSTKQQIAHYDRKMTPVERFFARSPFSIVTLVVRFKGSVSAEDLKNAVAKARQRHINLRYRIIEDENDTPWFTTEGTGEIPIEIVPRNEADDWIRIVQQSNQIPFEFETHPAIRIILVQSSSVSELIILCHHIICDGLSLAYLARDLMNYLGNPDQEVEVLPDPIPISLNNLPDDISQNGIAKYFINRINKKWNQSKVNFDQEDYRTITQVYWQNFQHPLVSVELSEADTFTLVARCREEKVTVNSAITTAFSVAPSFVEGEKKYHSRIVVASNLRERIPTSPGEGMGMYAGGVEMKFKYDRGKSFWENARTFHKKVTPRYTNKNMFREALTWSYLEPSISEAMNFKKISGLLPTQEPQYEKLYSFSQRDDVVQSILKREKLETFDQIFMGTAVTNLTRLDFPRKYGDLELDRLIFKPGGAFPLSNVHLLVGAVTCSGKISLLIEYSDKNFDAKTMEKIKEKALSFLLND
jgi:NRPS condensation-like uncharacterized protein